MPKGDRAPDHEVLNQGEVADGEDHLKVYHPDDGGVHCGPEDVSACHVSGAGEGLGLKGGGAEEEDDDCVEEAGEHPGQDFEPAEEDVLNTFLVQSREL